MPGRGGGPGGFGGALVARCIRLAVPFDVDSVGPFGTVSDGFIDWLDAMEDKFVAVLDGPSGCWEPLSEITASFLGGRSWVLCDHGLDRGELSGTVSFELSAGEGVERII